MIDAEFIPFLIKLMPLLLSLIALCLALILSIQSLASVTYVVNSKTFFESCKWFYNETINHYLSLPTIISGRHFFEQYEKRTLELHGLAFIVSLI